MHLIKKNEKVGASEATLLQMLKIYPFSYGLKVLQGKCVLQQSDYSLHCVFQLHTIVYDSGTVFLPSVLDITNDDLLTKFLQV